MRNNPKYVVKYPSIPTAVMNASLKLFSRTIVRIYIINTAITIKTGIDTNREEAIRPDLALLKVRDISSSRSSRLRMHSRSLRY